MEENNQSENTQGQEKTNPTETTPPVVQQESTAVEAQIIKPTQTVAPNSIAALILGIVAIAVSCAYGAGIVVGAIALKNAKKGLALYNENPDKYTEGSFKNLKAGKLMGTIGLWLSIGFLAFIVIFYTIVLINA